MRVPLQWLADYVEVSLTTKELADALTMSGLKVESIERIGEDWQDVYIGQIVELQPHPTSNKPLNVARVDLGDRSVTVVTGAPNVKRGDKAPIVLVGGLIPHGPDGGPFLITSKPMAGIASDGMLASQRELGLSDEHTGIYILPPDAPVGEALRNYMGGDVLDIETNPNRPDTLSIIGIAREVAALTQQQLTLPDLALIGENVSFVDEESITVEVLDPDLCPRYSALRVDGVGRDESPGWMIQRLEAAGMRSISLLVDLSNYIMLEYGQPMHAFDARQLQGDRIVVRRAGEGESITTLDGVERALTHENLVIADAERAVAIAGVMGGENSEIADDTTTIVLESATFDPVSVRRTSKALGLRTEASARFEKGLPPEATVMGIRRFLQLLAQITGAQLRAAAISDVWVGVPETRTVVMPMRDLHRLTGLPISTETAAETLSLLGFDVEGRDGALRATVPFWRRVDIEQSADLVEEVIRLVGFDALSSTLPRRTMEPPAPLPMMYWQDVIRTRLQAAGASETVTHSLTSPANMARLIPTKGHGAPQYTAEYWASIVPNAAGVYAREATTLPVRLANPATTEREILRLTLIPSLLDVVARNLKHTEERLAFFELAATFFDRPPELPYERHTLGIALSGQRTPPSWAHADPGDYTFYDIKGMLESVLQALQIGDWSVEACQHPSLHPGRSGVIRVDGHNVAYFGELHPDVATTFDIDGWRVQVAEVDLDALVARASGEKIFRPLPRYPAVYRDIAVIVSNEIGAGDVMTAVRSAGGELLQDARIFDVYTGTPLPEGSKSVAVGMTFRAPGSTLTQEDVVPVVDAIVAALRDRLHATLRE